jgi:hypothetical protein
MPMNPVDANEFVTHDRFNPEDLRLKESPNIERVPASAAWVSTGYSVAEDDIVIIDVDEDTKWSANPRTSGMYDANGSGLPARPGFLQFPGTEGAMIGKIGQFIFEVGLFVHVHVPKGVSGELLLSINDDADTIKGNEFSGNEGAVDATITIYTLAP